MKTSLKKLLAISFSLVMLAMVVTGCGNSDSGADKVYNIGICQLVQHDALDAATEGFHDALVDELGEDNLNFDLQNAG